MIWFCDIRTRKLCKEMSQESKDFWRRYDLLTTRRCLLNERRVNHSPFSTISTIYTNISNTIYKGNHTDPLDKKRPPKPNREWRRDDREW